MKFIVLFALKIHQTNKKLFDKIKINIPIEVSRIKFN